MRGGTSLHDAVLVALDELARVDELAIEASQPERDTDADAIDAARLAKVPIFPVPLGTASPDRELASLLGELARATGGMVTEDVAPDELGSAYDRVLGFLRSTYVLVYEPRAAVAGDGATLEERRDPPEAGWHELRVELRRPMLTTIVREGYYR